MIFVIVETHKVCRLVASDIWFGEHTAATFKEAQRSLLSYDIIGSWPVEGLDIGSIQNGPDPESLKRILLA